MTETLERNSENRKINIAIVGDIMLGDGGVDNLTPEGVTELAERIQSQTENAQIVLANLENPVTDAQEFRENKKYNLKSSAKTLNLFDNRFVLCLANNHIMDFGAQGLIDTLEALETRNLVYSGAGKTLNKARKPAVVEVDGIKLGILCASDPRYQQAGPTQSGTCPATPDLLREIIADLRDNVDVVVAILHMGMEFVPVPTPLMQRLADLCLEEGARIVVFHHSHCISGWTSDERGTVIWGAGNYLFPYNMPRGFKPWFDSCIWNVELSVPKSGVDKVEITPIEIDSNGFPAIAQGTRARRIKRTIDRWSNRLKSNRFTGMWRLCSLMRPSYLWVAIANYLSIARRQGIGGMLKSIFSTLSTQFKKG